MLKSDTSRPLLGSNNIVESSGNNFYVENTQRTSELYNQRGTDYNETPIL